MANALPTQATVEDTGERHMPNEFNSESLQHVHRYAVAQMFCKGKDVADVACGEGFGSNLIAQVARQVTGVDISDEVIAYARAKYGSQNLSFMTGGVANLPLASNSLDVVVSMETIEHHDQHEEMLKEIKRVLRPAGVLIISTPEKLNYSDRPAYANPFHVNELYLEQFRALVGSYFKTTAMLFQKLTYGSVIVPETPGCGFKEFSGDFDAIAAAPTLEFPITNICIASDAELPVMGPSLFEGMRVINDSMMQTQQLFLNSTSLRIGRLITWPFRKFASR